MQDTDALDAIEGAANPLQIENIGLRVFDVVDAFLAGFSPRISKAPETEVDRKETCPR